MNAIRLLDIALAAGLSLAVEGDNLVVETDGDPPPALIAELRQHKAELIAALLSDARNAWPTPQEIVRGADDRKADVIMADVSAFPRRDDEPNLIAPLPWHRGLVSPAFTEEPYDQPCRSRCGQTKRGDAVFLHFVSIAVPGALSGMA